MDLPSQPRSPTWVDFAPDSVQGLDLLGLRLPVQSIGLSLLNGVTTISPKVRYLSFRTFMADAYRTLPSPPLDSQQGFVSFAAPAEAAYAMGNALVEPDATNIVGIDRARTLLEAGHADVPLEKLVSQLAVNIYAGPAQDLGLVGIRAEGAPSIDPDRGLPLARTLRASWGTTTIGRRILNGEELATATVEELREFGQTCSVGHLLEEERSLLVDVILPTSPRASELERLRTYSLLLHLAAELSSQSAQRVVREGDLMQAARRAGYEVPDVLRPALDGWLLYQVRDCLAVAHEAALGEVVSLVGSEGPGAGGLLDTSVLEALLQDRAGFQRLWDDLGMPATIGDFTELRLSQLREIIQEVCSADMELRQGLRRWRDGVGEWELMGARRGYGSGALLLLPLAWLLAEWRVGLGVGEELPPFETLSFGGATRFGLRQVLLPLLKTLTDQDVRFDEAIAELTTLTVGQHVQTALSRLAQDPRRDVAVLRIEGSRWIKLRDYPPGRTASRIPQAIDWLRQLGLVSGEGITNHGVSILERSLSALGSVATA